MVADVLVDEVVGLDHLTQLFLVATDDHNSRVRVIAVLLVFAADLGALADVL